MKLLFIILAHNEPEKAFELADTVTQAATDAEAIIHFDGNASNENFLKISELTNNSSKVALAKRRISCQWGAYSLVDAVLGCLRQKKEDGQSYDYVVLLSGSCLPCRPIKQLERFFQENYGKEFIEAYDESWMISGLRKERYQFYWPFPPTPKWSWKLRAWEKTQRILNVKRKPPQDLEIRFGSQWWALTWNTCEKIINFLEEKKSVEKFFKKTYIPDEMMINSLVWDIVGAEKITGFGLTHFQFTDKGKPVVFYDDHEKYPFTLNKFFYRKVSDEAVKLRLNSLNKSFEKDDGADLSNIGLINNDYFLKIKEKTEFPVAGQMYYRDQYVDMKESVLKLNSLPYIFVCGPAEEVKKVLDSLNKDIFEVAGGIFSEEKIKWYPRNNEFYGLSANDSDIRDLHPLLYLQRARARTNKIPVFSWVPGDLKDPLETIKYDKNACIVSLTPMAINSFESRNLIFQRNNEKSKKLYVDYKDVELIPEALAYGIDGDYRFNIITCPIFNKNEKMLLESNVIFQKSLKMNKLRFENWFDYLAYDLSTSLNYKVENFIEFEVV